MDSAKIREYHSIRGYSRQEARELGILTLDATLRPGCRGRWFDAGDGWRARTVYSHESTGYWLELRHLDGRTWRRQMSRSRTIQNIRWFGNWNVLDIMATRAQPQLTPGAMTPPGRWENNRSHTQNPI